MDENQERLLEQMFHQTSKPTLAQKDSMAEALNLPSVVVLAWFNERRARAKEEKRIEEIQTRVALENAHQIPAHEGPRLQNNFHGGSAGINTGSSTLRRSSNHRTQSEASYASLARSLAAAAACMPSSVDAVPDYDRSFPPSPVFHMGMSFPSHSPTNTSYGGPLSSSMMRNDSEYSCYSNVTPGELIGDVSSYPFFGTGYDVPAAASTTMNHGQVFEAIPIQAPAFRGAATEGVPMRPKLQRTYTAPEHLSSRPIPRRTVSTSSFGAPAGDDPTALSPSSSSLESAARVRRRPKLSPLGVGMARSKSSLGYEPLLEHSVASRRNMNQNEFPYPITPVRRVASTATMSSMTGVRLATSPTSSLSSNSPEQQQQQQEQQQQGPDPMDFGIHFPPSPISPDHGAYQQQPQFQFQSPDQHQQLYQPKTISAYQLHTFPIPEDKFTPPPTPLSVLDANAQNILAGSPLDHAWSQDPFKMACSIDFSHNDLTLSDIFSDQELALQSF